MTTEFIKEPDNQWDERPRGAPSRAGYHLGWAVAIVWAAVTCGYGLWQMWTASGGWFEKTLVFGGIAAFVLIFSSVVIDRLRSRRTDPYLEVDK